MSKLLYVFILNIILLVCCSFVASAPHPQAAPNTALEAEDLDAGVASVAVKDSEADLEASSSYGYGYYSSPYLGHYGGYGGYYPYYGYGLGSYYGLGYPYYGGYYGHHGGLHGHYY